MVTVNRRSIVPVFASLLFFTTLPLMLDAPAQAAHEQMGVRYAWGYNVFGVLGTGTTDDTDVPVESAWGAVLPADRLFTDVDVADLDSEAFACGVAGGQAYCWGRNRMGQLGANTLDDSSLVPRAVDTSGALAGKTIVAVSAGRATACALDSDGRAYCWGDNFHGELGNGSTGGSSDEPVAVVSSGVLAGKRLIQIASGYNHTCARDTEGALYCWGFNSSGQLGDGTFTDGSSPVSVNLTSIPGGAASSLAVGANTSCVVSATGGKPYCWGSNRGQFGDGTWNTTSASPVGADTTGVLAGVSLEGMVVSERIACAWDDSVYCWGDNGYGQLGFGSRGQPWESFVPAAVTMSGALNGKDIDQVSVGTYSVCALDSTGSAYCWGAYWQGRLGIGPIAAAQYAPVAVSGGHHFADIAVGDGFVSAITGPLAYTVTYEPNQATSGNPPPPGSGPINSTYTVATNSGSLARSGYTFAGWNTNDQGTGTTYAAGMGTFTLTGDTTLYAKWQALPPPPPAPSPPGPPYLLTATAGNRQVALTWAPPDWPGTSPVTTYRVYAATGGLACTTATTTCTVTGLTNGQRYEFWVTAINSVGESATSRRLTATPRPDPPGAPFLATVTGGNTQATVAWDPPDTDGGAPITEYRVFTGSGTRVCTVAALTQQCTATGLTNGQRYEFWVTAVNSAGESAPSRRLSVIPALALPDAPFDVAGTAGDKRIHWAWKPPESEGSYPVERYQVILNPLLPTVGGIACTVTAPETSCTVAKLTPGTTYTARVRAWSKAGWGPWSTSSTGITVPLPPPPGISVEVRRLAKNPDEVRVKGRTQGIKPGTELWVWIHRETEYGYFDSFQGASRPVVDEDGTFTWERSAPQGRIWEVIWCTQPNVKGTCSRWTLL